MYRNIAAECRRKRISIGELCKRLGVSRQAYYRWMRAGKIPNDKLHDMAEMFNCLPEYLTQKKNDG